MGHRDTLLCDTTYRNATSARSATRERVRRAAASFKSGFEQLRVGASRGQGNLSKNPGVLRELRLIVHPTACRRKLRLLPRELSKSSPTCTRLPTTYSCGLTKWTPWSRSGRLP